MTMTVSTMQVIIALLGLTSAFRPFDPAVKFPLLDTHFDNAFIGNSFSDLQDQYPDLISYTSLGATRDHEMYQATITQDVLNWRKHNRPSVKYIANMHGNEVRGRGLLMKLAFYLTRAYRSGDPDVIELLSTTIFHLVPTVNPDGFAKARSGSCRGTLGRYTSENTDLNRDFPDRWRENISKSTFSTETQILMSYADEINAVLGLSFHDGALVANYPLDGHSDLGTGVYAKSDDDKVFVELAKTYALNHPEMAKVPDATLKKCGGFTDGITNGNKWYQVFHGMQDWNYFYKDCFEITIELGCCKYPDIAALVNEDVWSDNFYSVMNYTKMAQYGIRGTVTDFMTKNPLTGATIAVLDVEDNSPLKNVTVRHHLGFFWRLLARGTYKIVVSKAGFFPIIRSNVIVPEGGSVEMDFALISRSHGDGEDTPESGEGDSGDGDSGAVSIGSAATIVATLLTLVF